MIQFPLFYHVVLLQSGNNSEALTIASIERTDKVQRVFSLKGIQCCLAAWRKRVVASVR